LKLKRLRYFTTVSWNIQPPKTRNFYITSCNQSDRISAEWGVSVCSRLLQWVSCVSATHSKPARWCLTFPPDRRHCWMFSLHPGSSASSQNHSASSVTTATSDTSLSPVCCQC